MNPELTAALASQHHRDLAAAAAGRPAAAVPRRPRPGRARMPRYRVTWTRTTLPAVLGRRSRSWVIIITATRPLLPRCHATRRLVALGAEDRYCVLSPGQCFPG